MSQPIGTPFPDIGQGSDSLSLGVSIVVNDGGAGADGMSGLNSQFLEMVGNPTSGTFTLSLSIQEGIQTTVPIPWNVAPGSQSANDVQTLVMNATGGTFTISNGTSTTAMPWNISPQRMAVLISEFIGVGYNNIAVTGVAGILYVISGAGSLFETFIPTFLLDVTSLIGTASLTHTIQGNGSSLTLVKAIQQLPWINDTCTVFAEGTPGQQYTISFKTLLPQLTVSTPYDGQPFLVNLGAGDTANSVKILVGPDAASTTVFTLQIYVLSSNTTYTIGPVPFNIAPKDLRAAIIDSGALNSMMYLDVAWNMPIPANDVQTISIAVTSGPTGSFTISFDYKAQINTTQAFIPEVVTAADIQASLESFTNIGTGNVSVIRKNDGDYEATFINQLGFTHLPKLIINKSYFGVGTVAHTVVGTPYPTEGPEIVYGLTFQVHVPLFIAASVFNGYVPQQPNAIVLAGSPNSYGQAGDAGLPVAQQPRSISFWAIINQATSSTYLNFASLVYYGGQLPGVNPSNSAIFVGVLNFGTMRWCASQYGQGIQGGSVNVGEKYFITLTYDGTLYYLYANSVLIASGAMPTNTLLGNGIWFGSDPARQQYISSSMQDIRFYNRTLSQAEINTIYNSGNQILTDGVTAGLVRWYKTTEGFGTTTADAIAGYTSTLTNAGWLYIGGQGGGSLPTAYAVTGYNTVVAELGDQPESAVAAESMVENVTIMLTDSGKGEEYAIGSPARVAYPDVPFITGQR